MKRMIENITGNYAASASIIDGTLILSLPDAITPVVWRMELGHTKASAIEVRPREDGAFTLLLKTPRGDLNDIALFATRGRAVAALMAVTRAMEQAHGQLRPANDSESYNPTHLPVPVRGRRAKTHPVRGSSGKNWIGGIAALALILILGGMIFNMAPRPVTSLPATSPAAGATGMQTGVAVSADEFLKNQ